MLEGITDATFTMTGGYKTLSQEEIISVLRKSL